MKKLTKLEKFGLIAAIITCGTYFYMNKVYDPEAKSLKRTVKKLNSAIKQYNELGEAPPVKPVQQQAEKLDKMLQQSTAELKEAGGRTDSPAEITEILTTITTLAEKNGLSIVSMAPNGKDQSSLINWAIFKAEMEGGYHNFKSLVAELEAMAEPIQLRALTLHRLDEKGRITISAELLI